MSEERKNEVLGQNNALDESELADVTGGKECVCVLGGGGEVSEKGEKLCVCVLGGAGEWDGEAKKALNTSLPRCTCPAVGLGNTRSEAEQPKCDCPINGNSVH